MKTFIGIIVTALVIIIFDIVICTITYFITKDYFITLLTLVVVGIPAGWIIGGYIGWNWNEFYDKSINKLNNLITKNK